MKTLHVQHDWLCTLSGTKFFPCAVTPAMILIEDIAHGLAGKYRFGCQSRYWYSVAQHSIAVSHRVPRGDALWGLLHDAAEAWLPDVQRPLKPLLHVAAEMDDSYGLVPIVAVEDRILRVVAERFGLSWPMPESVRLADDRELARERRDLFDRSQPEWEGLRGIEPYPERIEQLCLVPELAERQFLERYWELVA